MNAISVRRIEPEVHDWLREQAAEHGVSMEEEVRSLLRAARDADAARRDADRRVAWEAVFALSYTPPPGSPSAVEILREDRDSH